MKKGIPLKGNSPESTQLMERLESLQERIGKAEIDPEVKAVVDEMAGIVIAMLNHLDNKKLTSRICGKCDGEGDVGTRSELIEGSSSGDIRMVGIECPECSPQNLGTLILEKGQYCPFCMGKSGNESCPTCYGKGLI